MFASNSRQWLPAIKNGEPIPNPTGTARHGIVDPRDVSAVAVEALTTTTYIGQTLELTGPELLNVLEQAAILARIFDKPVRTLDVTLEQTREHVTQLGLDPAFADVYIAALTQARTGRYAYLTDHVPRILGRPATSFEQWAHDHRDVFG